MIKGELLEKFQFDNYGERRYLRYSWVSAEHDDSSRLITILYWTLNEEHASVRDNENKSVDVDYGYRPWN